MREVSVIMAAYNAEKFIRESIESIIKQSFENWELIICDDNSTDSTFSILKEYEKLDERIIVLRNEENKKAGYSRNRCIKKAEGNFIAIQDADDISLPNRFEEELSFLLSNENIDFVGTAAYTFNDQDERKKIVMKKNPEKKDFLISFPFIHASIMFRRNVVTNVCGYRISKETIRGQDSDMIMRMYGKGYVGANLKLPLYLYRQGKVAEKRRTFRKRMDAVKIRYKRFKEMGLFPRAVPYIFIPLFGSVFSSKTKNLIKKIIIKSR